MNFFKTIFQMLFYFLFAKSDPNLAKAGRLPSQNYAGLRGLKKIVLNSNGMGLNYTTFISSQLIRQELMSSVFLKLMRTLN